MTLRMKQLILCLLLIPTSLLCFAQADSLNVDPGLSAEDSLIRRGVFVAIGSQYGPVLGEHQPAFMGKLGITYSRWHAGISFQDFTSSEGRRIIFPNFFFLKYRHAGLFGSYRLAGWKFIGFHANMQVSLGDVVWETESGLDRFRDIVIVIEPSVGIEIKALPFLHAFAEVGYRQFIGVDLVGTDSNDLSGPVLSLGLKLGYYQLIAKNGE